MREAEPQKYTLVDHQWWQCPRSSFQPQPHTNRRQTQIYLVQVTHQQSSKAHIFREADITLFSLQVLNSGGQLQISRPAPEPPRTNGGSNVYQQPHQHVNSNGTYGEYQGQRQSEEEG